MFKTIAAIAVLTLATACTSTIPTQKYVDAMSALGCKGLQEGNPAADEVLKQNGVTPAQIQHFRQKSKFDTMAQAAGEIAKRVAACAGINQ